jgi:hypothetical protein
MSLPILGIRRCGRTDVRCQWIVFRADDDGGAPPRGECAAVVVWLVRRLLERRRRLELLGAYCQRVAMATFSRARPPTPCARPLLTASPFLYLRRPMKARTPTTRATTSLTPSLA